jgi:hypothetical protein
VVKRAEVSHEQVSPLCFGSPWSTPRPPSVRGLRVVHIGSTPPKRRSSWSDRTSPFAVRVPKLGYIPVSTFSLWLIYFLDEFLG